MRRIILAMSLLLASCSHQQQASKSQPFRPAEVIEVPIAHYVKVPAEYLVRCEWKRKVRPSESMAAARRRGECAEQYERQLDLIGEIEGAPVPPSAPDNPTP